MNQHLTMWRTLINCFKLIMYGIWSLFPWTCCFSRTSEWILHCLQQKICNIKERFKTCTSRTLHSFMKIYLIISPPKAWKAYDVRLVEHKLNRPNKSSGHSNFEIKWFRSVSITFLKHLSCWHWQNIRSLNVWCFLQI